LVLLRNKSWQPQTFSVYLLLQSSTNRLNSQAQEAQALQYARLDPAAQAQYGFYRAGQQLGGAIGGALGGEDPQLKLISHASTVG
jgi:hypothetical protein